MSFLSRRKVLNTLFGGAVGAATGAFSYGRGVNVDDPFDGEGEFPARHTADAREPTSLRQYLDVRHGYLEPEKLDRIASDFDHSFLLFNAALASVSGLVTAGFMQTKTLDGMLEEGAYQAYFAPFLNNTTFFGDFGGAGVATKTLLENTAVFAKRYDIENFEAFNIQFSLAKYFSDNEAMKPVIAATLAVSGVNEVRRRRTSGAEAEVEQKSALEPLEATEPLKPRSPWDV